MSHRARASQGRAALAVAFGPPDVLPTPLSRSPEDTADSSKCHTAGGVAKVMPDNNRLEQDHRGIKDRYRPMRGFKSMASARRFCRTFDEVRILLRVRSLQYHHVPADRRDYVTSATRQRSLEFSKPHNLSSTVSRLPRLPAGTSADGTPRTADMAAVPRRICTALRAATLPRAGGHTHRIEAAKPL